MQMSHEADVMKRAWLKKTTGDGSLHAGSWVVAGHMDGHWSNAHETWRKTVGVSVQSEDGQQTGGFAMRLGLARETSELVWANGLC